MSVDDDQLLDSLIKIHYLFTKDHYSGADFAKKEVQDDHGVVTGEYR